MVTLIFPLRYTIFWSLSPKVWTFHQSSPATFELIYPTYLVHTKLSLSLSMNVNCMVPEAKTVNFISRWLSLASFAWSLWFFVWVKVIRFSILVVLVNVILFVKLVNVILNEPQLDLSIPRPIRPNLWVYKK